MSAVDRGNQGTNLMHNRLKLRMDHQMAHPIIEVFPGEVCQETEAYYRKFSCKTRYQKKPPKNQTKNLSDMRIGQVKIVMNTQMHREFKWRYQNAELKKGLISKTFQNSSKFWYFRIRTKKQKKEKEGCFIWLRIQMQII